MIKSNCNVFLLKDSAIKVIDGDRGSKYPCADERKAKGYCLFLNTKNVTKNGFIFDEVNFISKEQHNKMLKGQLQKNDIVLSTRGTVGHLAYYNENVPYPFVRINSGMVIIRNENEKINTDFLFKLLTSEYIKNQIDKLSFGSAQKQLTVKSIKNLKILIPSIQIQIKIVNIISIWDNAIELCSKLIDNMDSYKTYILFELLNMNLNSSTLDFKEKSLAEISSIKGGYVFKEEFQGKTKGEIPFVKINDFNLPGNEKFIKNTKYWVNKDDLDKMKAKVFKKNSIVFAKVGASLYLNKRRLLVRDTAVDNNIICIIPNEEFCNYEFLYQLLLTIDFANLSQKSSIPLINKRDLLNLKFRIPNLDMQDKISNIFKKYDEIIINKTKVLQLLKIQKNSLLNKLIAV
ncbi:restriction endonuclease subunit S [Fluviispira multicolorata]|uniref:Type I restriction modification DNA specificity domain-containing protein n=1 Tax=Fluviispira multicolorata TaxID=2654512 RepID=A0A833JBI1_9BACT|nr:restriction endonuclease subunit S [Fluviispira multicolorata]KAB8029217.1 hypothetical protein GCL57_11825 [Fluviispira multicolorata]